jgi:hypothetical protein
MGFNSAFKGLSDVRNLFGCLHGFVAHVMVYLIYMIIELSLSLSLSRLSTSAHQHTKPRTFDIG